MTNQQKAGVNVLAVMDAMVLSAERLAAGEVVTSCAATVEVARQTRAAVAELIEKTSALASALIDASESEAAILGPRYELLRGHLKDARAALARVQGGA